MRWRVVVSITYGVTATGHIAEIGLKAAGKSHLGFVVSPALWGLNYASTSAKPSSVDISLWIVGLRGGPLALASLVLGYIKSLVDDDMERKAKAAIRQEPQLYRKNIVPLAGGWGPPSALAARVAEQGGTAWRNPNGIWLSIVTKDRLLVPNYQPASSVAILRPVYPSQRTKQGRFVWTDKLNAPVAQRSTLQDPNAPPPPLRQPT